MAEHLIHIGYPKTGSHWLRRWFAGHPQLAYSDGGIAGFQNVQQIAAQSATQSSHVIYRVTSNEEFLAPHPWMENLSETLANRTPVDYPSLIQTLGQSLQEEVAMTLAALFPNARILMITRGFRSMMLSTYSQLARLGTVTDFTDYCDYQQRWAQRGGHLWDYGHMLDVYRRMFGVANVIVLPYEYLRDDVDGFTRILEKRLGLEHCAAPPERLNVSLSPLELGWYPILTRRIAKMPVGTSLNRRLFAWYTRGAMENRYGSVIRVLNRFWPVAPVTSDMLASEVVESFRGAADQLRNEPFYERYAREYLF